MSHLIELGVPAKAGLCADDFLALTPPAANGLVVVHPSLVDPRTLISLVTRKGKPGFVVEDMTDLDEFVLRPELDLPESPLYVIERPDRGDDLRNASPDEAWETLAARGRRPLTVNEGISWLLQEPEQLEPNHCFMTIASRKPKSRGAGYDARTPALWISGGTGRDGVERRDAPKLGWCWAGNRHTWLGFASVTA